jgi:hypothetical protein
VLTLREAITVDTDSDNERKPLCANERLKLERLRRSVGVFNLYLTHCLHCGGDLRIVAAILKRQAIEKILNHFVEPNGP